MINPTTKRIITVLMIAMLLFGFMPINSAQAAFSFQVDEGYDYSGEENIDEEEEKPEIRKVSFLEKKLVEVVHSLLDSLREFFGLYSIDQLIYNTENAQIMLSGEELDVPITVDPSNNGGITDTIPTEEEPTEVPKRELYYGGVMPKAWYNIARSMHLVFQAIAWSLIGFAIVKNLLQINLGTINPMMRFRFYDGIRDLFLTGFLLAGSLLIVETLFILNVRLVDVFGSTNPAANFRSMYYNRGDLGSALIQIFYLFIEGYLNFVYIIRAISTAILIATAPLFIVSITFEGKNVLFVKWIRELMSNIFLQSFHAFMLSFLLSIQFTATGFENMVIMFSLIPLTEFFRSLILGESRGAATALGMGAVTAGMGMAAGAAGVLEGNKRDKKHEDKDSSKGEYENRDSGGKIESKYKKEGPVKSSEYGPVDKTTKSSLDELREEKTAGGGFETKESTGEYGRMSSLKDKEGKADELKDTFGYKAANKIAPGHATQAAARTQVAKNAGKTVLSAAAVVGGVGAAMVTGGKYGGRMAGGGLGNIGSNAKDTFSSAKDAKNVIDDAKNGNSGGNIMHAEKMSNGHVAIHRDKNMVSDDGLVNASNEGRSGIHNFTYDTDAKNITPENKMRLNKIEKEFQSNSNRTELQERYGIEDVSRDKAGNLQVRANKTYLENMGVESVYHTKNRHVETKRPGQPSATHIAPDFKMSPKVEKEAKLEYDKRNQS